MTKIFKLELPKKINKQEHLDKKTDRMVETSFDSYQACDGAILSAWAKLSGISVSALDITESYCSRNNEKSVMGDKIFKIEVYNDALCSSDIVEKWAASGGVELKAVELTDNKEVKNEIKHTGDAGIGENTTSPETK